MFAHGVGSISPGTQAVRILEWEREIHPAIQSQDAVTLRRLAEVARREEDRWLETLADAIEGGQHPHLRAIRAA